MRKLNPCGKNSSNGAILLGLIVPILWLLPAIDSSIRDSSVDGHRFAQIAKAMPTKQLALTVEATEPISFSPSITVSLETPQVAIYIDPEFGYTINYPIDWAVLPVQEGPEKGSRVDFRPDAIRSLNDIEPSISVIVYQNPSGLDVLNWLEQHPDILPPGWEKQLTVQPTTVDDKPGERIIGLPSRIGTVDVFVPYNEYLYRFLLEPYDPTNPTVSAATSDMSELFDEMLESFSTETP